MNIQIQTCGLVILFVLFFFHMSRETVGFYGSKLYSYAMISNLVCLVLDIASIFVINADAWCSSTLMTVIVSKAYLVSLIWVFYFGFSYTLNDIYTLHRNKALSVLSFLYVLLGSALISAAPIRFYTSESLTYSYGPATTITFIFAPTLIISTLLLTVIFRKKMNQRRKMAVRVWMILETIAGLLQFFFPELLLIGFATSVGMMVLYMVLENPERELDRTIDVFSTNVMHDYLRYLYEGNKPFGGAVVMNPWEWDISRAEEQQILLEMGRFLKSFPKGKVFRGTGNDLVLIVPLKHYSEELIRSIYERFILSWNGHDTGSVVFALPDSRVAKSADELTQYYQYFRTKLASSDTLLFYLDDLATAGIKESKIIGQEIISALEEDRVEVFYQPIYSFEKKCFVSAEALARIRRKDGSIMMPGDFIPVAEKTGLVEAIGTRVTEKVCEMLQEHPITEICVEYIEINLSVAQCENPWLTEEMQKLVEKYEIPSKLLNLEITETSAIKNRELVIATIEKLTAKGFSFSLDDFGTGESNLNYIVDMPVSIVKFDRDMTQDYFRNDKTKVVMNSIIGMVQSMGLKIVAEGIEEADQLNAMGKIGVDYIQGYYFSKPLPLNEFLAFIHIKNAAAIKER
ncbi:MAG: EAL domain-containing protein [Lachnospiraceae bacterium]|nr:EAL domain-containing protein [Lachnospiraceae bacterium]